MADTLVRELLIQILCDAPTEMCGCWMSHHAGKYICVFTEEHSLRGPAVHFAKIQCKCHLSNVVGRCMAQSADHKQYQTTHL
jgi:hypothetical protein